jgi:hypothetical protein
MWIHRAANAKGHPAAGGEAVVHSDFPSAFYACFVSNPLGELGK